MTTKTDQITTEQIISDIIEKMLTWEDTSLTLSDRYKSMVNHLIEDGDYRVNLAIEHHQCYQQRKT